MWMTAIQRYYDLGIKEICMDKKQIVQLQTPLRVYDSQQLDLIFFSLHNILLVVQFFFNIYIFST